MPIRNYFRRAGGADVLEDRTAADHASQNIANSAANKTLPIKEPTEYKLSEINDSGVYLPPSPTQEKPSFWHTKSAASTTSSNHRSVLNENEPFSISRESFECYRRSFDISARSPVPDTLDQFPRQSLDARRSMEARRSLDVRRSRAPPRSSFQDHRRPDPTSEAMAEEGFEDVGLNDEPKPQKKRGIFSRFGDNDGEAKEERPLSGHHFGFTGRKRAQSGSQGSEMKSMPKQTPAAEVPVEAR